MNKNQQVIVISQQELYFSQNRVKIGRKRNALGEKKVGRCAMKNTKINANGTEIRAIGDVVNEDAYISLIDIAKYKNPEKAFIVVANWMRNHSTISFLELWEQIHNPNLNLSNSRGLKQSQVTTLLL